VIREVVNKMRGGGIVAVMLSILEVFLLLQVLFINPYYSECTLFNLLLLLPLTGIFWLLQLPAKALYIVQGAVLFFVYYLNTYVLASRQRPIHFMDITASRMQCRCPVITPWYLMQRSVIGSC